MKIPITTTIDKEMHEWVKNKGYAFNEIVEMGINDLKRKNNIKEYRGAFEILCSECHKGARIGWYCPYLKKTWCSECHNKYDFMKCQNMTGESIHIHPKFDLDIGKAVDWK